MMMQSANPSFSFAIPAYNVAPDIATCLQHVLAQSYEQFDVVVVDDDSRDETPQVVQRFTSSDRVRFVRHDRNRGLAATRNSGIDDATGDVVIFLDADVTVPVDFLERLASHYRDGGHAVAVESRVADQRSAPARFLQAVHETTYPEMQGVAFSQAFSCRRNIAKSLRFSEEIPACGADDAAFSKQLRTSGYIITRDPTIVVDHALPTTVSGLWRQAVKRGRAVVHFDFHVRHLSPRATAVRRGAASTRALIGIALVIPAFGRTMRLAKHSRSGRRDTAAFWLHHHVYLIGYHWGQITELPKLKQKDPST